MDGNEVSLPKRTSNNPLVSRNGVSPTAQTGETSDPENNHVRIIGWAYSEAGTLTGAVPSKIQGPVAGVSLPVAKEPGKLQPRIGNAS